MLTTRASKIVPSLDRQSKNSFATPEPLIKLPFLFVRMHKSLTISLPNYFQPPYDRNLLKTGNRNGNKIFLTTLCLSLFYV
jgi:hypothetical protein